MLEHLTARNSVHLLLFLSDEEPILRIWDVHTTRALLVVVSYVVDATADEVAAHEAGMIGL